MTLLQHAQEGFRNLCFSKLRSLLALLGILIGTASVVAMVLGGELATQEALRQFKSLGTDLFAVSINQSMDEGHKGIAKSDSITLEAVTKLSTVDTHILNMAPYTQLFSPISYQGNSLNGMAIGVTENFFDVLHIEMQSGRMISLLDRYQFYCVIGQNIYDALKQLHFEEPLGKTLHIGKQLFIIVGVAKPWAENSFVYADINNAILIPIMASSMMSKYAVINNIIMRLSPNANAESVEKHLESAIHSIVPDKQLNFRSAKELIAKMKKQNDILTVFLGLIGSISLFVGGIGVMNIMLVSVIERRREIGIRLAVGAWPRDIQRLFLMESVMLSLFGGSIGVILGILVAYFISLFWHWQFTFFWWPPLVGFSVSVAVGIFFGFYPAYMASRLNPIDALRTE